MKRITTLLLLCCFGFSLQAQLYVAPNAATNTDSFVYVQDEILFVEQDVNLVKNNNNPDTEASIYLRREAQLIQGATASKNLGTGLLSVFQEGSTNKYDYNNWTSPVSVPTTTLSGSTPVDAGMGTFGPSVLYTPKNFTESGRTASISVDLISGFDSMGGSTGALEIPDYWFFYYPSGSGYQFVHVQDDNYMIPAGYAFTMKGVSEADTRISDDGENIENNPGGSNQRYDFRGRPNSGTIEIGNGEYFNGTSNVPKPAITPGDLVYVGNPYPSALDLNYFLLEHSQGDINGSNSDSDFMACDSSGTVTRKNNTTGVAYFWDSIPNGDSHFLVDYEGGYEIYSPVACGTLGMSAAATFYEYDNDGNQMGSTGNMGSQRNRSISPIAQGFFIRTVSGFDDSIAFENRHRVYKKESATGSDSNIFKRDGSKGKQNEERIVIPKLNLNIEVNETYTRQLALGFWPTATKDVDRAMDAPVLGVLSTDAGFLHDGISYGIDVRPFDVDTQIPLYLNVNQRADIKFTATSFENFDTEEVYLYDSEEDTYYDIKYKSFTKIMDAGNYNGRFFLTFKKAEVLNTEEFVEYNFDVFQNNAAAQLEIKNPNSIGLNSIAIFDVSGKRVLSVRDLENDTSYTFSTRNFQEGVYIVQLLTSNKVPYTRKITISNR